MALDLDLSPRPTTCMRCRGSAELRFYGLCPRCTDELHAKFTPRPHDVEVEAYTPGMHVTPNAVALKDD